MRSRYFVSQPDVWVSPTGTAEASGLSALAPISLTELSRRMGWPNRFELARSMTIHFGAVDYPLTQQFNVNLLLKGNGILNAVGTPTVTRSSTFTAFAAIDRSTGTPAAQQGTDGSFDWTASVGRQVVVPVGSGAVGWVAAAVSAGVARMAPFSTSNAFSAPTMVQPAGTASYQVQTLPRLPIGFVNVETDNPDVNFTTSYLKFLNLHLAGGTTGGASTSGRIYAQSRSVLLVDACWLDNLLLACDAAFTTRCRYTGSRLRRGELSIIASLIDSNIIADADGGRLIVDGDTVAQGCPIAVLNGRVLMQLGNAAGFGSTALILQALNGAFVECRQLNYSPGVLYGRTSSGYSVRLDNDSTLSFDDADSRPTVNAGLGDGREALVGGTDVHWDNTPYFEDSNGCRVNRLGTGAAPPPPPPPVPPPPVPPPAPPPAPTILQSVGININGPTTFSTDHTFADAAKVGVPGTPGNIGGDDVALDANGWPTADFSWFMGAAGLPETGHGTLYKVSFTGLVSAIGDLTGNFNFANLVYNAGTNTTTVDATLSGTPTDVTIILQNTKRTSGSALHSGVTNLKVMKPSYTTETFTATFKTLLASFGVVRHMDSAGTNNSSVVNWADRIPATYSTQFRPAFPPGPGFNGKGMAWELAIQLANETSTDIWVCVPAQATDAYVSNLASLLLAALDAARKIYVEYSNEVWNSGTFDQYAQSKVLAEAEVAGPGGSSLNYDGETDHDVWTFRRTGKRGMEISNIFRGVFGDAAMMTRVRPVLAWQLGSPGDDAGGQATAFYALTFLDNFYNNGDGAHVATPHPPSYFFWGGGGSAYYNPDNGSDTLTNVTIFTSQTMNVAAWAPILQADSNWCAVFGLVRAAYEGGPSFDNEGHSEGVKASAWALAGMRTAMTAHQQNYWQNSDKDALLVYYQSGGLGSDFYQWGFVSDINTQNTQKMLAVGDILGGSIPAPTYGTAIPASLTLGAPQVFNGFGFNWNSFSSGNLMGTAFRVTAPATFTLTIVTTGAGTIRVMLDGATIDERAISGGQTLTYPGLSLAAGIHGIAVRSKSGGFGVSSVSFA